MEREQQGNNMQYVTKGAITEDVYNAYIRKYCMTNWSLYILLFLELFLIYSAIRMIINSEWKYPITIGIVLIVLNLLFVRMFLSKKEQFVESVKSHSSSEQVDCITGFAPDSIYHEICGNEKTVRKFSYQSIQHIFQTKKYLILITKSDTLIPVFMEQLSLQECSELPAFLRTKKNTALEPETIAEECLINPVEHKNISAKFETQGCLSEDAIGIYLKTVHKKVNIGTIAAALCFIGCLPSVFMLPHKLLTLVILTLISTCMYYFINMAYQHKVKKRFRENMLETYGASEPMIISGLTDDGIYQQSADGKDHRSEATYSEIQTIYNTENYLFLMSNGKIFVVFKDGLTALQQKELIAFLKQKDVQIQSQATN